MWVKLAGEGENGEVRVGEDVLGDLCGVWVVQLGRFGGSSPTAFVNCDRKE